MNPVIISRPLNSFDVGQLDAAIYVINTNLSAPEFDAVFRDAINDYIAGRDEFEPAVQRTLAVVQKCVEESLSMSPLWKLSGLNITNRWLLKM